MNRADDSHLTSLVEQIDRILLSLHSLVLVEGLYSWGAVIEVGWQHCFGYICQEERGEPHGSVLGHSQALEDCWDLCNPSPCVFIESVEDVWLESLEDHAISSLNLTVSIGVSN